MKRGRSSFQEAYLYYFKRRGKLAECSAPGNLNTADMYSDSVTRWSPLELLARNSRLRT
jgi:hypothetical protein